MNKTKILLAAEFTGLSTGYGNYGRELLTRLLATDKYEIAEYSSYIHSNAPETQNMSWKVFGVEPDPKDEDGQRAYSAHSINQFGRLKFEETVLRYKPDVILSIRDPWTESHICDSPFRKYFKWIYQPTVDSIPQENAWLSMFGSANATLTYTEWGAQVLREQSGGIINPLGGATPIPDDLFEPTPNKRAAKEMMGLDHNYLLVGSAMRAQPRKLIPDLMEAFTIYLNKCNTELASRSYLWIHTTYPDVAHDLPELLKEYGILSKCFFTYLCHTCGLAYPTFFSSANTFCKRCGKMAMFPSTRVGVDRNQLKHIFQSWDFGIQYANCEGLGMPLMEMAACGVPCAAVDYSAMSEVIRNINGMPIKVERMFRDHGTNAKRALPDNKHLAEIIEEFLSMPSEVRLKKGFDTRIAYQTNYSWEKTVDMWEKAIEFVGKPERVWSEPQNSFGKPDFSYNGPDDSEFLRRGIIYGVGREDLLDSYLHNRMSRDLSWGCQHPSQNPLKSESSLHHLEITPYGRKEALEELKAIRNFTEYWEDQRVRGL